MQLAESKALVRRGANLEAGGEPFEASRQHVRGEIRQKAPEIWLKSDHQRVGRCWLCLEGALPGADEVQADGLTPGGA